MSVERKGKIVLWSLVALVVLIFFAAHSWKSSLKVKNFSIEGNMLVSKNEILQLLEVQKGTLLFKTDLMGIQNNVLSHYYVKNAVVKRNLPTTIVIQIEERVPIAILNCSSLYYVDDEGVVLPRTIERRLFDLPLVSNIPADEKITLGATLSSPETKEALAVLRLMKTLNRPLFHTISEIKVHTATGLQLVTAENCVPILLGNGNIEKKFVKLEAFWNQYVRTRGTSSLEYIDMRFAERVIARWTNTSEIPKTRL